MKLSYFTQTNESVVLDANRALDEAQDIANNIQRCVRVYNWAPGTHKHGSLYLIKQPIHSTYTDTPMAEEYYGG